MQEMLHACIEAAQVFMCFQAIDWRRRDAMAAAERRGRVWSLVSDGDGSCSARHQRGSRCKSRREGYADIVRAVVLVSHVAEEP